MQKWEAIRSVLLSSLDESRKILLSNVIETYLILNETDTIEYIQRLRDSEPEVLEMISIYEERARERFLRQGIEQGIRIGQLRMIRKQFQTRFGAINESTEAYLQSLSSDALEALIERMLTASSPEELGFPQ